MNVAVLLSGGVGSRIGSDIPKQYIEVAGEPVLNYSLRTLLLDGETDKVIIALADEWRSFVSGHVARMNTRGKEVLFSESGETRLESVYNALLAAKSSGISDKDVVLIHESARPLVPPGLIARCYSVCGKCDGVLPVMGVKDTIYRSGDGSGISGILDRRLLWSGQAPEAFVFGKYFAAHTELRREGISGFNGCAEVAFTKGLDVRLIPGDPLNFKITTEEDLISFRSIVTRQS